MASLPADLRDSRQPIIKKKHPQNLNHRHGLILINDKFLWFESTEPRVGFKAATGSLCGRKDRGVWHKQPAQNATEKEIMRQAGLRKWREQRQ